MPFPGARRRTRLVIAQKYVEVDKAFVQFAGFTAGRAASFFDFYAHDLEMIGSSIGSDASNSTNLFAYTATFGGGLVGDDLGGRPDLPSGNPCSATPFSQITASTWRPTPDSGAETWQLPDRRCAGRG